MESKLHRRPIPPIPRLILPNPFQTMMVLMSTRLLHPAQAPAHHHLCSTTLISLHHPLDLRSRLDRHRLLQSQAEVLVVALRLRLALDILITTTAVMGIFQILQHLQRYTVNYIFTSGGFGCLPAPWLFFEFNSSTSTEARSRSSRSRLS